MYTEAHNRLRYLILLGLGIHKCYSHGRVKAIQSLYFMGLLWAGVVRTVSLDVGAYTNSLI